MITALQNFISKKGKFVFVLLLFVVVISFVLYLSQGSSVFDLLPDPTREKKELYGLRWRLINWNKFINNVWANNSYRTNVILFKS